jgi:general secretion pathway protein F/type IV pilus assembly protein PilC
MKVFQYQAVRQDGQKVNSSIEAEKLDEAKRLLREQQLIILSLKEVSIPKKKLLLMSFDQKVIFTSQLAQLLEANVPLYEGLEALEEQSANESYQPLITSLREQIRKGGSFSSALSCYPDTFSPLFQAVVASGESVGRLDQALVRLSQLLTSERQSRQRLMSALLYPIILLVLLFAALIIMIFFVIPSMQGLFEGKPLPTFTWIVFSIAHFIRSNILLLLAGLIGGGLFLSFQLAKAQVRNRLWTWFLKWPLIGDYLVKSALGRFARTLSNLLAGGTTLSSALGFAKEALQNRVLEDDIEQALHDIIDGQRFSSALHRSQHIPPLFSRMVSIGEETGRLSPILANLAQLYEEDSERFLDRAVSLIQPVLLVAIGVIIGSTLLSILLPLANLSSTMAL